LNVQFDMTSARHLFEHCSSTIIPLEVTKLYATIACVTGSVIWSSTVCTKAR